MMVHVWATHLKFFKVPLAAFLLVLSLKLLCRSAQLGPDFAVSACSTDGACLFVHHAWHCHRRLDCTRQLRNLVWEHIATLQSQSTSYSTYWHMQTLCLAAKVPRVVEMAQQHLAYGESVVIGLQETGA